MISCHDSECWWLQVAVHGNDGSHRICQVYLLCLDIFNHSLIYFIQGHCPDSEDSEGDTNGVSSLPSMLYIWTERQLLASDYISWSKEPLKSQISSAFCVKGQTYRSIDVDSHLQNHTKSTKNHQHSLATPSEPLNSPAIRIRAWVDCTCGHAAWILRCFSMFYYAFLNGLTKSRVRHSPPCQKSFLISKATWFGICTSVLLPVGQTNEICHLCANRTNATLFSCAWCFSFGPWSNPTIRWDFGERMEAPLLWTEKLVSSCYRNGYTGYQSSWYSHVQPIPLVPPSSRLDLSKWCRLSTARQTQGHLMQTEWRNRSLFNHFRDCQLTWQLAMCRGRITTKLDSTSPASRIDSVQSPMRGACGNLQIWIPKDLSDLQQNLSFSLKLPLFMLFLSCLWIRPNLRLTTRSLTGPHLARWRFDGADALTRGGLQKTSPIAKKMICDVIWYM